MKFLFFISAIFVAFFVSTTESRSCNKICPQYCTTMCFYFNNGKCKQICNSCLADVYACQNHLKIVKSVNSACPTSCL
ncbi:hypothetical protein PVAND_015336 [Polypedilum vanderplanki]|uniref:Uncharacterized protein n=1 Tax=Polypedilum vanderplanki TaxID=319348 RepID=A0A9J6BBV5_POLVA|nr:hypothetical protein PVAND_015336 [Polypedilum vanderplanki]